MPSDPDALRAALEDAARVFARWRPRGGVGPAEYRSGMPEFLRSLDPAECWPGEAEAILLPPNAAEIARMDRAAEWLRLIPLSAGKPGSGERWSRTGGVDLRRLLWLRSINCPRAFALAPLAPPKLAWSWRRLGREFHISHTTAEYRHADALARLCRAIAREENRAGLSQRFDNKLKNGLGSFYPGASCARLPAAPPLG